MVMKKGRPKASFFVIRLIVMAKWAGKVFPSSALPDAVSTSLSRVPFQEKNPAPSCLSS